MQLQSARFYDVIMKSANEANYFFLTIEQFWQNPPTQCERVSLPRCFGRTQQHYMNTYKLEGALCLKELHETFCLYYYYIIVLEREYDSEDTVTEQHAMEIFQFVCLFNHYTLHNYNRYHITDSKKFSAYTLQIQVPYFQAFYQSRVTKD